MDWFAKSIGILSPVQLIIIIIALVVIVIGIYIFIKYRKRWWEKHPFGKKKSEPNKPRNRKRNVDREWPKIG